MVLDLFSVIFLTLGPRSSARDSLLYLHCGMRREVEVESIDASGNRFNPTPHAIGVKRPSINPEGIQYSSLNQEAFLQVEPDCR